MKVYVGGTFDLFHWGHIELLKKCAELGDVWVSLNTDEFASSYKRKPIMNYEERKRALESCKYVSGVVENTGGADSTIAIGEVLPDIIVHGDDWKGEAYLKQMNLTQDFLDAYGIKLIYLPYTKYISTSDIISRCRE
jgi:glycerol-3-phosphate cytidylyltransferase